MKIVPEKLKMGDEIRIIAPSRSMRVLKEDVIKLATERLERLGLKVTFGKNVMKYKDEYFKCATIEERIEDLHEAFKDKNVKAVMTVIGGYNVNQILDYIDYKLIQENPKKFVGLKLHPRNFNLSADAHEYKSYFKLAERYKLPCLVHCDINLNVPENQNVDMVSAPATIHKIAKTFPDVPIIMAHMGAGDEKSHQNAIDELLKSIDENDSKLYVDISWVDWGHDGLSSTNKPSIVKLITELEKRNATDRILFGTDAPLGCFGESLTGNLSAKEAYEKTVGDLKTVIKNNFGAKADELIEKIFYKNADELFFKKSWAVPNNVIKNQTSVTKAIGLGVAALALLTGVSWGIKKIRKSQHDSRK